MPIINSGQVFQSNPHKKKLVSVPEWGGDLYVRTLSGAEMDEFEAGHVASRDKTDAERFHNLRARFVALVTCNEDGKPIFSALDAEVAMLGNQPAYILDRVYQEGQTINGRGTEAQETIRKNSESAPTSDSGSK